MTTLWLKRLPSGPAAPEPEGRGWVVNFATVSYSFFVVSTGRIVLFISLGGIDVEAGIWSSEILVLPIKMAAIATMKTIPKTQGSHWTADCVVPDSELRRLAAARTPESRSRPAEVSCGKGDGNGPLLVRKDLPEPMASGTSW